MPKMTAQEIADYLKQYELLTCPYETLGIKRDADEASIKNASRTLLRSSHTDRNNHATDSGVKIAAIKQARDFLLNSNTRSQYDALLISQNSTSQSLLSRQETTNEVQTLTDKLSRIKQTYATKLNHLVAEQGNLFITSKELNKIQRNSLLSTDLFYYTRPEKERLQQDINFYLKKITKIETKMQEKLEAIVELYSRYGIPQPKLTKDVTASYATLKETLNEYFNPIEALIHDHFERAYQKKSYEIGQLNQDILQLIKKITQIFSTLAITTPYKEDQFFMKQLKEQISRFTTTIQGYGTPPTIQFGFDDTGRFGAKIIPHQSPLPLFQALTNLKTLFDKRYIEPLNGIYNEFKGNIDEKQQINDRVALNDINSLENHCQRVYQQLNPVILQEWRSLKTLDENESVLKDEALLKAFLKTRLFLIFSKIETSHSREYVKGQKEQIDKEKDLFTLFELYQYTKAREKDLTAILAHCDKNTLDQWSQPIVKTAIWSENLSELTGLSKNELITKYKSDHRIFWVKNENKLYHFNPFLPAYLYEIEIHAQNESQILALLEIMHSNQGPRNSSTIIDRNELKLAQAVARISHPNTIVLAATESLRQKLLQLIVATEKSLLPKIKRGSRLLKPLKNVFEAKKNGIPSDNLNQLLALQDRLPSLPFIVQHQNFLNNRETDDFKFDYFSDFEQKLSARVEVDTLLNSIAFNRVRADFKPKMSAYIDSIRSDSIDSYDITQLNTIKNELSRNLPLIKGICERAAHLTSAEIDSFSKATNLQTLLDNLKERQKESRVTLFAFHQPRTEPLTATEPTNHPATSTIKSSSKKPPEKNSNSTKLEDRLKAYIAAVEQKKKPNGDTNYEHGFYFLSYYRGINRKTNVTIAGILLKQLSEEKKPVEIVFSGANIESIREPFLRHHKTYPIDMGIRGRLKEIIDEANDIIHERSVHHRQYGL